MSTKGREQLLQLYHLALAREGEDRDAFLTDACAGDENCGMRSKRCSRAIRRPTSSACQPSSLNPHSPAWA